MFSNQNAVIYCRYSSNRQTEFSIEGQTRECMEFADSQGLTVIERYCDRARSGKDTRRPAIQRLLKDSRKGDFAFVIVWKLDRLTRSQEDYFSILKLLREKNVRVLSVTEKFTGNKSDILLEGTIVSLNQYYSAELSEKVKRGMKTGFLKGDVMGGNRTYGYRRVNHRFVIDDKEARIVKKAFRMYLRYDSISLKGLKEKMNSLPEVSDSGKVFNENSLYRMLTNERYIGKNSLFGETRLHDIPPIVSTKTFEAVKRKLVSRRSPNLSKGKK